MPAALFQKIRSWLPPLLWWFGILLASTVPGGDLPRTEIPYLDKVAHFILYGVLGLLLGRIRIPFAAALELASLMGILDELYQNLTPQRSPDPLDWAADVAGACLGILTVRWFNKKDSGTGT